MTQSGSTLDIKLVEGATFDTAATGFNVDYTPTGTCNANSNTAVDVLDSGGVQEEVEMPGSPGAAGMAAVEDTGAAEDADGGS